MTDKTYLDTDAVETVDCDHCGATIPTDQIWTVVSEGSADEVLCKNCHDLFVAPPA